jgi:uncharacterized membrane protein
LSLNGPFGTDQDMQCPETSIWRIELLHPMMVHFPIALLSIGAILRLIAFFWPKAPHFSFLLCVSWVFLGLGVVIGWGTLISGEWAKKIVKKTLCDRSLVDCHEQFAKITVWSFFAVLVLDAIRAFFLRAQSIYFHKLNRWFLAITFCLILFAVTMLGFTGDYGARLVYQQGAAVSKSTLKA